MKKLIVLFVSIVFSCTSYSEISIKNSLFSEKEKPKSLIDSSTFRLSLGETHLKLFNIQQKEYSGDLEINLLFERFNIEQKNLCEMIYGTKTKKNYIYSKFLKINSELPENKWLSKIITGCWNYYSMNDIGVENDFLLVRELYPDHEMDCYSVGFMQPYIMQGVLN
ncbi:MAG: hypothetical protein KDK36_07915, partial [Leptospiraceae bacterium]|nr:hypothetical protein [Leptospiraceae bacterium]